MPRKTAAKTRDERLEASISRDQKALLQRAALLQGRTLTDFVIAFVYWEDATGLAPRDPHGYSTKFLGADLQRKIARVRFKDLPSTIDNDRPILWRSS